MHHHQPLRVLHSCTTIVLHPPYASSDFHRHSVVLEPAIWNSISAAILDSASLDTFITAFKTHLFNCVYVPRQWQWHHHGTSDSSSDIWHQQNKSILYTVSQKKRPPFSYDCSFYKCWPISIIFGTQYTESMCNITDIYLLTTPTYCCYTTLGNKSSA